MTHRFSPQPMPRECEDCPITSLNNIFLKIQNMYANPHITKSIHKAQCFEEVPKGF